MEGGVKGSAVAVRHRPGAIKSVRAVSDASASSKVAAASRYAAGLFLFVCGITAGLAQTRTERMLVETTGTANPTWDTSLPGKWTYRSYRNRADVIVSADPAPAVQALDPIYGQGNAATASSALKALT